MKRYVSLINIGGDYCGMGLADSYPDFDYEDSCGQSRASNDEWVVAGAAAARIEALERENARLLAVADTLWAKLVGTTITLSPDEIELLSEYRIVKETA